MTLTLSLPADVMEIRLPSPAGIMAAVASAVGQDGIAILKRRRSVVDTCGDTGARSFKASLQASSIRAVDLKASVLGLVSYGGLIATVAQATAAALSPQGPGTCDRNMCERCCNIATSAPYIACGCHAFRHRTTASGKAWGASMVGVGIASAVFHGSYGSFREWGRRLDFWTIAASSNIMTRALFPNVPAAVTAAGVLATPFKPFFVSFVNSTAMELKFLAAARRNPKLRGPQRLHAACCLLGLGAFALEDVRPDLPLVHSVWHLLSSTAVATLNHLLADVEEQQRLEGAGAPVSKRRASPGRPYPQLVVEMKPLEF
ncbi:hypothetical protein Agub_g1829 [Astrephomene gubernaculifera]|uniref:Uncharacterized protein n=1 Tax=Astrephomene gubernaculifera TaxID=47775 RepID=A0AAD3HHT3_9CHLO|nr:hypothetical protein Agub_g1829 [Astrephomene gubernaculifera]